MEYGKIIKRSWQITWNNKTIWIFAALSVISTLPLFFLPEVSYPVTFDPEALPDISQYLEPINSFLPFWGASLLLTFLFGPVSTGGSILGIHRANLDLPLQFRALFKHSAKYYWRLLLLSILLITLYLLALLAFAAVFYLLAVIGEGVFILCLIPLLCLLIPAFVVASVVMGIVSLLSINSIVIEDKGIGAAVKASWQLFRTNLGSIVMATPLFVGINLAISIGISAVQNALTTALIALLDLVISSPLHPSLAQASGITIYLLVIPVMAVTSVFYFGLWTLAYLELRAQPPAAAEPQPAA